MASCRSAAAGSGFDRAERRERDELCTGAADGGGFRGSVGSSADSAGGDRASYGAVGNYGRTLGGGYSQRGADARGAGCFFRYKDAERTRSSRAAYDLLFCLGHWRGACAHRYAGAERGSGRSIEAKPGAAGGAGVQKFGLHNRNFAVFLLIWPLPSSDLYHAAGLECGRNTQYLRAAPRADALSAQGSHLVRAAAAASGHVLVRPVCVAGGAAVEDRLRTGLRRSGAPGLTGQRAHCLRTDASRPDIHQTRTHAGGALRDNDGLRQKDAPCAHSFDCEKAEDDSCHPDTCRRRVPAAGRLHVYEQRRRPYSVHTRSSSSFGSG